MSESARNIAKGERQADPDGLEGFIGYNLKRAYVLVHKDFRRALGAGGLSTRAFSALSLVVTYPNISQSGLARMLGIERSGLVALIDDLEGKELLQRVRVPGDRRSYALIATAKGQAEYKAAHAKVVEHERIFFSDMTPDEQATLLSLLAKIRASEEDR